MFLKLGTGCDDVYSESNSQDFPSFSADIDRLRGQVSDMTENECTDSELNAAFENHRIENQQQRFREQDEGFNGSAQTEYATEEDIYDLPDLERRSYTRSITTSPVSQTAHILGSVQVRFRFVKLLSPSSVHPQLKLAL